MADENPWRIDLDVDELHPFVHESRHGVSVPTSAEQVTRWRQVMAQFEIVQDEMKAAYDAARTLEVEARRVARAEAEVRAADERLLRARFWQAYPPSDPASWEFTGDGATPCTGLKYADEKDARAERMRLHNEYPAITFDIKPYVCAHGHHHLGRSS